MRNHLIHSKKFDLECYDTSVSPRSFYHKKKLDQHLLEMIRALDDFLHKEFEGKKVFQSKKTSASLMICGSKKIQTLNRDFRNKDKKTDVLSFPQYHNLRKGLQKDEFSLDEISVGDIVICKEVAAKQAKQIGHTLEQELVSLFLHGFLHCLGYDHEISDKEEKIMFALEDKIIKKMTWK